MNKESLQKVVNLIHTTNECITSGLLNDDVGCDFISDTIYNLPLNWKGTEDEDLMETFYQECDNLGVRY